jgi:hypothetical protein
MAPIEDFLRGWSGASLEDVFLRLKIPPKSVPMDDFLLSFLLAGFGRELVAPDTDEDEAAFAVACDVTETRSLSALVTPTAA